MEEHTEHEWALNLPLLESTPETLRKKVARVFLDVSEQLFLEDGFVLFHQRDLAGDSGCVLKGGKVEILREGTEPILLKAPALLGEIHQFNPHAQRTATVQVKDNADILKFSWPDFYARAQAELNTEEQVLFMQAMERCVCERLDREPPMDIPIFRGLPAHLKVRACLCLQWVARHVSIADGVTLFEQNALCGDTGVILLHGTVELRMPARPVRQLAAPNILGVFPLFDPEARWTATANAKGPVELIRFAWRTWMALLEQRMRAAQLEQFVKAALAAGDECLVR